MFLTEAHRLILYEIYGVPLDDEMVVTSGNGYNPAASYLDTGRTVHGRLERAIQNITISEAKTKRIVQILEEYEKISLDFASINRDGYNMNPRDNLKRIHAALYPYTGIIISDYKSHRISLG